GDGTTRFRKLPVRRRPLTYVPSPAAGGAASTLEVAVNGVRWREVGDLYGQPPDAQVYTVRTQEDGTSLVQFGDGRTGAIPPTGAADVVATYRVGSGLAGRVGAGALANPLDRPPGLVAVANPLPAEGGADPETVDAARSGAPRTVRTFGRAVSLQDFAELAT